jgi:ParB family transcriptional regulator, chromosome partitioning protein
VKIPIDQIDVDSNFNCRGTFLLQEVRDLASQIKRHGLIHPVTVVPSGDRYRLIAGFRRFAAIKRILNWKEIECNVMDVDEEKAREINLIENLERQNLDPLTEAKAMIKMFPEDRYGCREVASRLKKTTQWVLLRRALLKLPKRVQDLVVSGRIPISRVQSILKSPDQDATVKALLSRKHPRQPLPGLKRRGKREVSQMIERLMDAGLEGLSTRLLAWVNGYVSDDEIEHEINKAVE